MELLKGESLWTRLEREGRSGCRSRRGSSVQMCKALRTAHEAGLVHRDLKPGNVFLARKDDDEVVKILDFGIAKAAGLGDAQAGTGTGMLMGSVHYMSPEQIRSRGPSTTAAISGRSASSCTAWWAALALRGRRAGRRPRPRLHRSDSAALVGRADLPPGSSVLRPRPRARSGPALPVGDGDGGGVQRDGAGGDRSSALGPGALVAARVAIDARPRACPHARRPVHTRLSHGPTIPLPRVPAPIAPFPPAPAPYAPPSAPLVPPSRMASPNVASPPRAPNRGPMVVALVVPLVLLVLGGVALLRTMSPAVVPAPTAASAEPAVLFSSSSSASSSSSLPPLPMAAPVTSAAAAPSSSPTTNGGPRPPVTVIAPPPSARHPGGRAGCNPPYTLDARGVRVPKMECL